MNLVTTSHSALKCAAKGVMRVQIVEINKPKPNTCFPPTLSAKSPPGIWVITYPQKNALSIIP